MASTLPAHVRTSRAGGNCLDWLSAGYWGWRVVGRTGQEEGQEVAQERVPYLPDVRDVPARGDLSRPHLLPMRLGATQELHDPSGSDRQARRRLRHLLWGGFLVAQSQLGGAKGITEACEDDTGFCIRIRCPAG
jgi:hypothetical protein